MTASPSDNESKPDLTGIPSVFDIVFYSVTLTKRHASDIYGFIGYLLFPLILYFGIQGIPGILGDVAITVVNILFIVISCWAAAAISTLISLKAGKANEKKQHDPRSISAHATSILGKLLFAVLLSALIQSAGYILLVVPGILATILLTFTFEEVVLRGHGPLSALAASKTRVQHQIFAIGWRLFSIAAAFIVVYATLSTAVFIVGAWITNIPVATLVTSTTPLWIDAVLTVVQLALIPPVIVAHTVLYLASSPEKE